MCVKMKLVLYTLIVTICISYLKCEDFYSILGIHRGATLREIRKAFKELAVKLHPDKNQEDTDAESKFIKLTRAYEVLKDPDARKMYDLYGDVDQSKQTPKYHSYSYYRDHFGIYDDDPLIVTLSKADYEVNVLDNSRAWFVNFYSPQCHHCHELAPIWRRLATEFEGVVRIGAVNCADDWALCYQLGIKSYPTLLFYEKEANLHEGVRFGNERSFPSLKEYVLSQLRVEVHQANSLITWQKLKTKSNRWIVWACCSDFNTCSDTEIIIKTAAIFDNLIPVATTKSEQVCQQMSNASIAFWKVEEDETEFWQDVNGTTTTDIVASILNMLPSPPDLTEEEFGNIRDNLRTRSEQNPWLLCFHMGQDTELNVQLRHLPIQLASADVHIGLVNCARQSSLCAALHVQRYPTWAVLKAGNGAFEIHHGRNDVLHEIAAFARDSAKATNMHALSPADFAQISNGNAKGLWLVDWFAPWCPPCRQLMPELRKASQQFDPSTIEFGTIDCTMHRNLCSQQGIRSYPSLMVYNGSQLERYHGALSQDGIVEFVHDIINPPVYKFNGLTDFEKKLSRKPSDELWVVDFFAPWCGACVRLAPEWRKLARAMRGVENVHVASVDCDKYSVICQRQHITSYPTIRLYPLGSEGLTSVAMYNGQRNAISLESWLYSFLPSSVIILDQFTFKRNVLGSRHPSMWLVDFYAPWCSHCVQFEPKLRQIATHLEGKVSVAKLDCEKDRVLCAQLDVNSYPTLYLYTSSTNRVFISHEAEVKTITTKVLELVERYRLRTHDEL